MSATLEEVPQSKKLGGYFPGTLDKKSEGAKVKEIALLGFEQGGPKTQNFRAGHSCSKTWEEFGLCPQGIPAFKSGVWKKPRNFREVPVDQKNMEGI